MTETGWRYAEATGDLETALAEFHWQSAFVREVSGVSPSRILPDGSTVSPEAPLDIRLVVVAACSPIRGVELHVHEAQNVVIPADRALSASTRVERDRVYLSLGSHMPPMVGRALRWRWLSDEDAFGEAVLGREFPGDLDDPRLWEPRVR